MSKLPLSVAVGNYDRVRPLMDGAVQIDGVDPVFMNLPPEEIFFRAFRGQDFDICECSLSSFTVKTALGNSPYVGVPAFVSRMFRHGHMYRSGRWSCSVFGRVWWRCLVLTTTSPITQSSR